MADANERLAKIEEWARVHEKTCDDYRQEVRRDTGEIKNAIAEMIRTSNDSRARLHQKFDELATTVQSNKADASAKAGAIKNWILRSAVVLLVALCAYGMVDGFPWQHLSALRESQR